MAAGMSKSFTIGADSDDTITVDVKSFALADGASAAGTGGVKGTATVAATTANLLSAIESSGSVQISDGSTMLNINLQDIQVANNDATLSSLNGSGAAGGNDFDMSEFIVAVEAKADASSTFTGTFSSSDETGFTVSEKAAFYGSDDTYTVTGSNSFSDVNGAADGTAGVTGGIYGVDFSDYKNTSSSTVTVSQSGTITALDTAIKNLSSARADFGAVINRLEHTVDNLNASAVNTKAARSGIVDADYASETTELARTQIISQASTAMLSQANQQAQSVLALLK